MKELTQLQLANEERIKKYKITYQISIHVIDIISHVRLDELAKILNGKLPFMTSITIASVKERIKKRFLNQQNQEYEKRSWRPCFFVFFFSTFFELYFLFFYSDNLIIFICVRAQGFMCPIYNIILQSNSAIQHKRTSYILNSYCKRTGAEGVCFFARCFTSK